MDSSTELLDLFRALPEVLRDYDRSQDMAHEAMQQLEALLPDSRYHNNPLDDLKKIIRQDDDTIFYAVAMHHAQKHMKNMISKARSSRQYKVRALFDKDLRDQAKLKDDFLMMAITALVVIKIKRDIIDKYELPEKENK